MGVALTEQNATEKPRGMNAFARHCIKTNLYRST